jgi:DNA-binding winged helix-turn-helix (wHTH) protein
LNAVLSRLLFEAALMKLAFGDCVLDLAARQLSRGGEIVALEPKMYQLLEVLIQRRPAVVTNQELDEILWPKTYVARSSLTRLVSELRAALGDTPSDSQLIRTAYKTGYSFCAEVRSAAGSRRGAANIGLVWKGQLLLLSDGEHIAGRGAECSLVIDAATVSRQHARITIQSGIATIEDLGSTNGTHVDGVQISSPTEFTAGAKIALGTAELLVKATNAADPTIKVDSEPGGPLDVRR